MRHPDNLSFAGFELSLAMSETAAPDDTSFDHSQWLADQIARMEAWLAETHQKRSADPNEVRALEHHLEWLRSQKTA
jgi:hypothetical protein